MLMGAKKVREYSGSHFPCFSGPDWIWLFRVSTPSWLPLTSRRGHPGGGAQASGPRPFAPWAAAKPRCADHAGRSRSGHAQWPGRCGRLATPGRPLPRGGREGSGRGRGHSRWSGRRPRGAGLVGAPAGRAGMSHGIGQGGRESPAHESQVSGASRPPPSPHPNPGQAGLQLRSQANLDLKGTNS